MRSSSRRQSPVNSSIICNMRSDKTSEYGQNDRQFSAQETRPLAHCNPALQQKGTDLIDDAGALADQPLAHPMQRLQIELVGRLGGDEFHRRALHRLGNRLRVAEIGFLRTYFAGISRAS